MMRFSQRYGYTPLKQVIVRERITPAIENSICNAFDSLESNLERAYFPSPNPYDRLQRAVWVYFMNQRDVFFSERANIITKYIKSDIHSWFEKVDLLEFATRLLKKSQSERSRGHEAVEVFISNLNREFERHNFAYRIVDDSVIEINSKEEIESVEKAIAESADNIKHHLKRAVEAFAQRPEGDYINSIKESISAVEAFCREKTGKQTLGDALKYLESAGLSIPRVLKDGFEKLYAYTNQPSTGIRHALMDTDGTYIPSQSEAYYMLVTCSAFINYLLSKAL
ncbi:MAG: hypothetical protein NC082_08910 [Clostridiales bacterium]|nr:hypothetical protein [Clostridiales bacterium]